ncbi:hypothetical protein NEMBOFW57_008488 [Staphylotrichum longicolle]|uniref:Uncharacterized protein n=1 Tax=Staphylotrichum longicolle TaxID=669026 RepID=A0AAD4ERE6_9PEZI|nr:hypothetical protein NEMBOFW57_008488 [Staphylotrichum longicolle]
MSTSTTSSSTKTSKTPLVITSFPSVPLTATFTAPGSDCGGIYAPRRPPVYMIDDKPSCLPPGFSTSNSAFFYSPGIACPAGYWTACHDTTGAASITTVTCCPTYGDDIKLSCVADPLTLSEVWETLFCTWIAPRSPGTAVTLTKSGDGRTSTVVSRVTGPGGINAYGVRMVHQASDLEGPSTTSPTSSETTSPTTTTTATSPEDTTPPQQERSPSSTGLSTGAKAAIGVAVPLAVLAALALGLWVWWRRRKGQGGTHQQQQHPSQTPSELSPQVGGMGGFHQKPPGEGYYHYGSQPQPPPPQEMAGMWEPPELPSTRAAAELDAGGVGAGVRPGTEVGGR